MYDFSLVVILEFYGEALESHGKFREFCQLEPVRTLILYINTMVFIE